MPPAKWMIKDKVVLITGGSSGIGKATAIELARMGATVYFVSNHEQRGQAALADIRRQSQNDNVYFLRCDLSLMSNVRSLAAEVHDRLGKLDVLINNAGILPGKHTLTVEGFELCWAINHLAPFLLTNLLTDLLMQAGAARIINISSEAHRLGQINFNQEASSENYSSFTAYCDSKMANIMFTYELSRRLELTPVTVNCLHPGVIASSFGNTSYGLLKWLFLLGRPFMKSSRRGAATIIYLAASPELAGVTGQYFKNKKQKKSAKDTYSTHLAQRLWGLSEEQTGLLTEV